MKRTGLKHFLVPSVLVHAVLIATLAVYFLSDGRKEKDESYIIGLTDGVEIAALSPASPPGSTEQPVKSETNNSADAENPGHAARRINEEKSAKIETAPAANSESAIKKAEKPPERATPVNAAAETEKQSAERELDKPGAARTGMTAGDKNRPAELFGERGEPAGKALASAANKPGGAENVSAIPAYDVNPKPPYPNSARRRGYEGEVRLRVLVLENGTVGEIMLDKPSGYEILDDTALDTVRKWKFKPATENGREVSSWVTVPIKFKLDKG